MFSFNIALLRTTLSELLQKESGAESFDWLIAQDVTPQNINRNFSLAGRKFSRKKPDSTPDHFIYITGNFPQTNWNSWSILDMARLYQLLQLEAISRQDYIPLIEALFRQADLGELTLLYKALPFYAYAEEWIPRCAEGIRSNMGTVLDAIMQENNYPSEQLPEAAWNQMILKAVFTGKDLARVYGLQQRNNPALATSLFRYAEERLAAGRDIDGEIWGLTTPFFPGETETLKSKFLEQTNGYVLRK
ncbi:EboA domain-containing protein [Niabella aurantiaca]|uniref:EboA domain-containing protein n=1 Tax=Niabella aurantiaca TaxID=379900 RepID=UPI00035FA028|nr:EboA domain-containing protein [Niabella aurantiaca]